MKHFTKHAQELGVTSFEEYKPLIYKIIKKPDYVFVQREINGETVYIFVKDSSVVVSSNDNLLVKSLYRITFSIEEWLKDAERKGRATIRIL